MTSSWSRVAEWTSSAVSASATRPRARLPGAAARAASRVSRGRTLLPPARSSIAAAEVSARGPASEAARRARSKWRRPSAAAVPGKSCAAEGRAAGLAAASMRSTSPGEWSAMRSTASRGTNFQNLLKELTGRAPGVNDGHVSAHRLDRDLRTGAANRAQLGVAVEPPAGRGKHHPRRGAGGEGDGDVARDALDLARRRLLGAHRDPARDGGQPEGCGASFDFHVTRDGVDALLARDAGDRNARRDAVQLQMRILGDPQDEIEAHAVLASVLAALPAGAAANAHRDLGLRAMRLDVPPRPLLVGPAARFRADSHAPRLDGLHADRSAHVRRLDERGRAYVVAPGLRRGEQQEQGEGHGEGSSTGPAEILRLKSTGTTR